MFCPLPWVHLSVSANGQLRLCCNSVNEREVVDSNGHPYHFRNLLDNWDQVFNGTYYKGIRKEMLNNATPSACDYCGGIEKSGGVSPGSIYRTQYNEIEDGLKSNTADDGTYSDFGSNLYLDLTLGNTCNLECRMCDPSFSTSLLKPWREMGLGEDKANKEINKFWTWDDQLEKTFEKLLLNTKKIIFQGGEPLLIAQVSKVLEKAIHLDVAKNISLKFYTNLTSLPSDFLNLIQKFEMASFDISLEGPPAVNDYIRQGSDWNKIEKNIEKLIKLKKVFPIHFSFVSVFQNYNAYWLPEFIEALSKWDDEASIVPIFSYIRFPEYLRPDILPQEMKDTIYKRFDSFVKDSGSKYLDNETNKQNIKNIYACLNMMKHGDHHKDHFNALKKHVDLMDNYYKTSFESINPEFSNYW